MENGGARAGPRGGDEETRRRNAARDVRRRTDEVEKQARVAPNVPTFFANAWTYVNGVEPPKGDAPISSVSDVVAWIREGLGEKVTQTPASAG